MNTSSGTARQQHPAQPGLRALPVTTKDDDPERDRAAPALTRRPGPSSTPRFVLGPSQLKGRRWPRPRPCSTPRSAQWAVSYTSRRSTPWDNVAQANFHQYVAIDLDGLVESAPLIQPQQASFTLVRGQG